MASLPPRPHQRPARRLASQTQLTSATSGTSRTALPRSAEGEWINVAQSQQPQEGGEEEEEEPNSAATQTSSARSQSQSQRPAVLDRRKCWICLQDEEEDKASPPAWVTPCKCSLAAHNACLLEWVADLEAPQRGSSRELPRQKKIRCPQCQSEIIVARSRNLFVEAVSAVELLADSLTIPAVGFSVTYAIYLAAKQHGIHSLCMIFGKQEAWRILTAADAFSNVHGPRKLVLFDWLELYPMRPIDVALPLIPITLIISRTSWSSAALPILPMLILATSNNIGLPAQQGFVWPPGPVLTLATLPYLQSIYRECMDYIWSPLEKKWAAEVSPRIGVEDYDEGQDEPNENAVEFEVRLEIEEVGAADVAAQQQPRQMRNADNAPMPPAVQQAQIAHREINMWVDALMATRTAMGALLVPSMSAAMGELLRQLLPKSWTTPKHVDQVLNSTGLLQTRWGRSIVGGCLAVVLRDVIRIYCRYCLAKAMRARRILNYDRKLGRVV